MTELRHIDIQCRLGRHTLFTDKERKALEAQKQQTEREIADKLDKIPDTLKADGYPDVQAFMATYRKMEAVVEQYNRCLLYTSDSEGRAFESHQAYHKRNLFCPLWQEGFF